MLIVIDKSGNVVAGDAATKSALAVACGRYQAHRAGSLLVLTRDEGTGAVARPGEILAMAGDVAATGLLSLMNLYGQNRETGRLVLKRDHIERVIMMHNGDVASIGSNLPGDRLGSFLVRMGKVKEADLKQAQREAEKAGKRIGQALLAKGLIDAHELWTAIQEQITELFADVVNWVEGSFALYRVAPDFVFPTTPPLPMQGLLLEAVRRADEMSVYRERIPTVQSRLRRTQKPSHLADDPELQLAAAAIEHFSDGRRDSSVAEIAKSLHIAEFDATRACYDLLKRGLVEVVKAQPGLPPLKLSKDEQHKIDVFNLAFREIHDEVARAGKVDRFVGGVAKFLGDESHAFHALFRGVLPEGSGALPVDVLSKNLGGIVAEGHEATGVITEALNELTFFMLFQCGELLDPQSDEHLGRRVRLIHASLR